MTAGATPVSRCSVMRDDAIHAIAMVTTGQPPPDHSHHLSLPPSFVSSFIPSGCSDKERASWTVCCYADFPPSARLNISMREVRAHPPPPYPPFLWSRLKGETGGWRGGSKAVREGVGEAGGPAFCFAYLVH